MNILNRKDKNDDEYYFLNELKLIPGDIILERGLGIHSKLIMEKTQGSFSHAMIYVGGTLIEATVQGGVYSRVPNRIVVPNENYLRVLRPKAYLDDESKKNLCTYARNMCGSAYSIREALIVTNDNKPQYSLTRGQFCSRLVAQAYASIGINLSSNIDFCSPADIEKSSFLEEITGLIYKGTKEQADFAYENSTHEQHQKRAVKWVRKSKKILSKEKIKTVFDQKSNKNSDIATINDILMAVYQNKANRTIDEQIAAAMISTGYNLGPFDDIERNPYRYSIPKFHSVYNDIPLDEREFNLNKEYTREKHELKHRPHNYFASYNNLKDNLNSPTFKVCFEIDLNMIKALNERLKVLIEYCICASVKLPMTSDEMIMIQSLDRVIQCGYNLLSQTPPFS
ncbi:hypothetical protein [Aeromonas sp. 600724]|uniref:hypothetical protein n=1 Tax=Aeromonas sp. 600724 TaxID=2712031 RepID=UPI003B9F4AC1